MAEYGGLRVLHIGKFYPPHIGGMESHLHTLCTELRKSIEVRAVVANSRRWNEDSIVDGVRVTRLGRLFSLAAAPVCPGLFRQMREAARDIVHLHLPNPFPVLAYLAQCHKGPLVVSYHSDIVRQRALGKLFQPFLRRLLDRCAVLVAASQNYVETSPVLRSYRERCRVIPYGIDIDRFRRCDEGAVAKIRQKYGALIILSVGRLVYYKGLENLVQAMTKTRGHLLIAGDGPLRPSLERQAHAQGVADRVTFLGEVGDLVPFYHAAQLFVLASVARSEAFGIVQLEAMASGKPVINTRLASGVPFVSLDGETGTTVPPADDQALAAAMNSLLDDPARRAAYGEAARQRVRDEFDRKLMASRTIELYRQLGPWRSMSVPSLAGGSAHSIAASASNTLGRRRACRLINSAFPRSPASAVLRSRKARV